MKSRNKLPTLILRQHLKKKTSAYVFLKNADFFASYVCNDINASISSLTIPNQFKETDIKAVHKKKPKLSK